MSSPTKPLQIVVVGAGICGLAAAVTLVQKGHHVRILERGRHLSELGAGIQIPANAMRIFDAWGLRDEFLEKSTRSTQSAFHRYNDGSVKGRLVLDGAPFGYENVVLHRADYQSILYKTAIKEGAQVLFGKCVTAIDETTPSLTLDDGSIVECDLIVSADGIGSKVRIALFEGSGTNSKAVPSPDCTYRVVLEREKMLQSPVLAPFIKDPRVDIWMGPGLHVIAYAIRGNPAQLYNVVLCAPGAASIGKWNEPVDLEVVHEAFSSFEPTVHSILDCADGAHQFKIAEAPPLPRWSSENGRVVLVGDAAHGMWPYAAQGAAQGIEDAAVLGECLSNIKSPSEIATSIKVFEELRKPRAERVQTVSKGNSRFWNLPDGVEQRARDARLQLTLEQRMMKDHKVGDKKESTEPDMNADYNTPGFSKWLYGYDAIGDATRRMKQEKKLSQL